MTHFAPTRGFQSGAQTHLVEAPPFGTAVPVTHSNQTGLRAWTPTAELDSAVDLAVRIDPMPGSYAALQSADSVRLAVDAERKRIALDMHDDVGHRLAVALFQVDQAIQQAAQDVDQVGNLRVIRRKLTDCIEAIRTIPWVAEDEELSQRDLRRALELLFSEIPESAGLSLVLQFDGDCESVANPTRCAAFRIAQEALSNALKYADASCIQVDVCRIDDALLLTISDDGKGIEETDPAQNTKTLGLRSMRSRSLGAGGTIEIQSIPGQGTRVMATFPVSGGAS
jgi:two-component system sensor histidine kinase UhpB